MIQNQNNQLFFNTIFLRIVGPEQNIMVERWFFHFIQFINFPRLNVGKNTLSANFFFIILIIIYIIFETPVINNNVMIIYI